MSARSRPIAIPALLDLGVKALAAFGLLNPVIAGAAMAFSSVSVVGQLAAAASLPSWPEGPRRGGMIGS